MTKISFACPYCGKKLSASDASAGKEKTCPNCRGRVVVPSPQAAAQNAEAGAKRRRPAGDHPVLLMGRRSEHHGDLIDMTAMVDIVFFLLIFFLVTSMKQIEAVINLPSPNAPASAADSVQAVPDLSTESDQVVVTIDSDDAVFVDDEEVLNELDLRSKLRAARTEDEMDRLMINGAADATHGKFVMVLDAGADAGMTEIQFTVPQGEDSGG